MNNPIFCAIDTHDLDHAVSLAMAVKPYVAGIKLGLEFFLSHSANGYNKLAASGLPIFLDLKLHDIPNTVAGAIAALKTLNPAFLTVHASGGAAMLATAAQAIKANGMRTKLLGVTVLTSLDNNDLVAVGQTDASADQVMRLAKLAQANGLDGVICSPDEITALRATLGSNFILMVPGIRPSWATAQDQKRIKTPREALTAGATYLVIGRPITGAENAAATAQKISEELGQS